MVLHSRRHLFATWATLALVPSGCVSSGTFRGTEQPIEGTIQVKTDDLTPDRTIGTENPDYNLQLRNARDEPVSGTLSIGPVTEGPAEREFDLPAAERDVFAVLFPQSGRYSVSVTLDDGTEESFEWEVSRPDPDEILSVVVEEDGGIRFTRGSY